MYYFKKQFSFEKVIDKFVIKFKRYCQMTKLRQFSNKLDVLCAKENNPWTGGVRCLTSGKALFPWDLGQGEFYRALQAAIPKQGMIG